MNVMFNLAANTARHYKLSMLLALLALVAISSTARADGTAVVLNLEGALGVATAEYIIGGIEQAEEEGANIVIIRMDTPGGLVSPMRDIVQSILGSEVPVVTYVSPGGARADSAGTYILLASHIAAMAPTTHLGAATPVSLTGDDLSPGEDEDAEPTSEEGAEEAPAESDTVDTAPVGAAIAAEETAEETSFTDQDYSDYTPEEEEKKEAEPAAEPAPAEALVDEDKLYEE